MGSMNNWLGFSLSPQELPQTGLPFNSDEISAAQISDESCFDLPPDPPIPSLNLPAPHFGILEAFPRNSHPQEWNMNTFSCSSSQSMEDQSRPKLENFLGVHQEQQKGNSNIGLSMITNWLRNNPTPPHAAEKPPPPAAAAEAAAQPAAAQTLSLSMSTGSQSEGQTGGAIESVPRKSIDTFGQRTSIYRGVTRHRWTGRYEAHLWDNSCRREGQTRKGRQVYLGGYDKEDKAARAYDLAALKYWGTTTTTNFPISNYEKEIEEMKHMTRQEYVASLRRKSSGFSRGASMYRGVTRHHQHGRWQARIGRVAGNKDLYLGTFSTEEEAAEAYDIAAIKFRGLNAVTNFEINRYDVKSILESATLPIGGAAKRLKDAEKAEMALQLHHRESNLNLAVADVGPTSWPTIAFQQPPQPLTVYPYQRLWCKQEHDAGIGYADVSGTHNFFQPSVLHNIMSMEEPGSGYGGGAPAAAAVMMGGTVIVQNEHQQQQQQQQNGISDYEAMFGSGDGYHQARNYYYQSQHSPSSNWIPTAVPVRGDGSGAAAFTVWNDA